MEAAACARTVLHVFENVDKDNLRDENADTDGTCQWRQTDTACGDTTVSTRAGARNTSTVGTASGT